MPYIKRNKRKAVMERGPRTAGELNYMITELLLLYLGDEVSYSKLNEIIGVLECAKLEMYRRLAAPYEDLKKEQNGDVYN